MSDNVTQVLTEISNAFHCLKNENKVFLFD